MSIPPKAQPIILSVWKDVVTHTWYFAEVFGAMMAIEPPTMFVVRDCEHGQKSFISCAYYPNLNEVAVRQIDGNITLPTQAAVNLEKLIHQIWPKADIVSNLPEPHGR